jgi:hypothetical protein
LAFVTGVHSAFLPFNPLGFPTTPDRCSDIRATTAPRFAPLAVRNRPPLAVAPRPPTLVMRPELSRVSRFVPRVAIRAFGPLLVVPVLANRPLLSRL